MGREENLEKLKKELQKEIKEECQVFCIMARIRKTLEHYNFKNKFPVLNLYCNWVFHTKLDRTDIVRGIFKKRLPDGKTIGSFLAFDHLRKEIKTFFKNFYLSEMNEESEEQFIKILSDILIETPLIIYYPTIVELNLIRYKSDMTCSLELLKVEGQDLN